MHSILNAMAPLKDIRLKYAVVGEIQKSQILGSESFTSWLIDARIMFYCAIHKTAGRVVPGFARYTSCGKEKIP